LFWVISSTTGDLHLAANRDDETIIALVAMLVPKKEHEICNVYGKQKHLQPSFQS
jgi:hypothetical protein